MRTEIINTIKINIILIIVGICLVLIGSITTNDIVLTFTMISGGAIIIIEYIDAMHKIFSNI